MVVTGNYVPCFVGCPQCGEALLLVDYCPCNATLILIMDKQAILIGNTGYWMHDDISINEQHYINKSTSSETRTQKYIELQIIYQFKKF